MSQSNKLLWKVGDLVHIQLLVIPTIFRKPTRSHQLISFPSRSLPHWSSQPLSCHPINYLSWPGHSISHSVSCIVNVYVSWLINWTYPKDPKLWWTNITKGSNTSPLAQCSRYLGGEITSMHPSTTVAPRSSRRSQNLINFTSNKDFVKISTTCSYIL